MSHGRAERAVGHAGHVSHAALLGLLLTAAVPCSNVRVRAAGRGTLGTRRCGTAEHVVHRPTGAATTSHQHVVQPGPQRSHPTRGLAAGSMSARGSTQATQQLGLGLPWQWFEAGGPSNSCNRPVMWVHDVWVSGSSCGSSERRWTSILCVARDGGTVGGGHGEQLVAHSVKIHGQQPRRSTVAAAAQSVRCGGQRPAHRMPRWVRPPARVPSTPSLMSCSVAARHPAQTGAPPQPTHRHHHLRLSY